jgi:hypothetical protein
MTVDRDIFLDALYHVGLDEDNLREDYSGRGMYGDKCIGIVCDISELVDFVAHYAVSASNNDEPDYDWLRDISADSMGYPVFGIGAEYR